MKLALATPLLLLLGVLSGAGCSEAAGPEPVEGELPTTVPAAAEPSTPAPAPSGPARIVFEQTEIDFGEVWDTESLEGRFPFTNAGGKPLNITEVKPSCGCTTTELARTRFEPGEGDALELVWEPKGHGLQAKTITVRSPSEGPGLDVLTIKATIKPFAKFEPNTLQLGEVAFGEEHRRRVRLTCVDPEFERVDVRVAHRNITAEVVGSGEDGSKEIEIVVAWDAPWGLLTGSVQATVRGRVPGQTEPVEHSAILSFGASLFGDLRMAPTMLGVGHVLPGRNFERRVHLTHAKGEPFQVLSAEVRNSQPPGMTARTEARPAERGGGYDLILSGASSEHLGLIRGTVAVTTDIPGEGERTLPVYGIVRE